MENAWVPMVTVGLVQFLVLLHWHFRVARVPRPSNVVEYFNSPLLFVTILCSAMIMAGPIILLMYYSDRLPKLSFELVRTVLVQVFSFAVMGRLSFLFKDRDNKAARPIGFFVAILLSIIVCGFLIWSNSSVWALVIVVAIFIGGGLSRFLFCTRVGRRTNIDMCWLTVAILLPLLGLSVLALDLRSWWPSLSDFAKSLQIAMEGSWSPLVIGFLGSALWIDLLCWAQGRFMMLPVKQS
jgi:hypothetical protein